MKILEVVGPSAPLVAVAGEDLVLPCFIKSNTSVVDMTVEWFKPYVKELVHLYKDHEDRNENQASTYRKRTSLLKEELQKGNASLKLSALRVSDEGEYKCFIEDKSQSDDITVNVIVEAQGSQPVIMMENYDNTGGIHLVCESRGWNPEPKILWLNREGDTLPAEDTQTHRETEGFSVKRSITVYDYSDSNRFYCRLQQIRHMIETEIIINNKVFDVWKWIVGTSVSSCLIAVGSIIIAVICYKKVDVTLDPDSAHPKLILSDDGKQVRCGDTKQNLTDTPQRFTVDRAVVGNQSFSSGRFYYEVQVRGKTHWILGVMRENINRKERIIWRPQNGFWTVGLWGNHYEAHAGPDVLLTVREKVEKLGVFVDYDEGLVSFYDVNSRSHIYSFTEILEVVGPADPLVVVAGEDLVLPCFIKSNTSAVDMKVEWFKLDVEDSLVHLYEKHEDRYINQAQTYRKRTSLFKEELQKGNASLKLSAVRVSDEGEYKCFIEDKSQYDDIIVNVIVEAQGSHLVIMMENYDNSGGIHLVCESRGWKPEPQILWLNREGDTLPAEDTQTHRDTEGFSVKSSITVHDYSDSNRFYCRLRQKHHMMETEIIINNKC
ncbi:butyrophilin-like protein 3 [Silurus meridionalis]|nr:butyrophilin-like protein 3 [Silurus meridionalis]